MTDLVLLGLWFYLWFELGRLVSPRVYLRFFLVLAVPVFLVRWTSSV